MNSLFQVAQSVKAKENTTSKQIDRQADKQLTDCSLFEENDQRTARNEVNNQDETRQETRSNNKNWKCRNRRLNWMGGSGGKAWL
jgi:hypothetical protein